MFKMRLGNMKVQKVVSNKQDNLVCKPSSDEHIVHAKLHNMYHVYSNRRQTKKKISNPPCTQLDTKQFQEMNFFH